MVAVMGRNRSKPVGGNIMGHGPVTQLELSMVRETRKCRVNKSPCLPRGTAPFAIFDRRIGDP